MFSRKIEILDKDHYQKACEKADFSQLAQKINWLLTGWYYGADTLRIAPDNWEENSFHFAFVKEGEIVFNGGIIWQGGNYGIHT